MIFTLREGDTSPALEYTMSPADVELGGATVRFHMVKDDGTVTIDNVSDGVTVVDETDPPKVSYQWQIGDTDARGRYEAEFRVTYEDGSVETFPARGFIPVLIEGRTP